MDNRCFQSNFKMVPKHNSTVDVMSHYAPNTLQRLRSEKPLCNLTRNYFPFIQVSAPKIWLIGELNNYIVCVIITLLV